MMQMLLNKIKKYVCVGSALIMLTNSTFVRTAIIAESQEEISETFDSSAQVFEHINNREGVPNNQDYYTFLAGKLYTLVMFPVSVDKKLLNQMLRYSLPLIPNAIIWFIIQLSDRYFISFYLGLGATGDYAIANKIPSLLYLINIVFYQSWQVAILEKKKNVKEALMSYFAFYSSFLFLVSSVLMVLSKPLTTLFFKENFAFVWQWSPFI